MPAINADTVDFWKDIAEKVGKNRPYAGRTVKIIGGRKHKGKTGTVVRHIVDRFVDAFRYADGASAHLREMTGRYGYVCQVRETETGELFWVKADYTECL